MSLLGWVVGLSVADALLGNSDDEREERRREADDLRRRHEADSRRIDRLEQELRDLKRQSGRGW